MKKPRERLVRAATNLFYKKGYSNTSIREIGAAARLTTSLFYHYFESKEDILFEIVNRVSLDLVADLVEIEKKFSDPLECVRNFTYAMLSSIRRKKEFKIWQEEQYFLRGKRHEICWEHQRQIYDLYKKKLKDLQEADRMNQIDVTVAAFSIIGVINWLFRWYNERGHLSRAEAVENIVKFILDGISRETGLTSMPHTDQGSEIRAL